MPLTRGQSESATSELQTAKGDMTQTNKEEIQPGSLHKRKEATKVQLEKQLKVIRHLEIINYAIYGAA